MKENVGNVDRALRVAVGLSIVGLGVVYGSWFGLLGLVPITTGLARFCPAYIPIGLNTKGKDSRAS